MDVNETVTALAALAHQHRLAIYRLLVEKGPAGLPAGEIADRVQLLPSSLTFHIQALQRSGLVTHRRVSRQVFYAADFSAMNELIAYLTKNCCGGATQARTSACTAPIGAPTLSRRQRRTA